MNKILCIGPSSNAKQNYFTGQSVMYDGIIEYLGKHNYEVYRVNISPILKQNGSLYRMLDYVYILLDLLFKLVLNKFEVCYLTTSQSKKGFIRDYAIVFLCSLFNVRIVAHQYGANIKQLTDSLNEGGFRRLKKMFSKIQSIIVEGEFMKGQYSFLSDYISKVKVIPNGLPIEGAHANNHKEYDCNKPFIIFYLSNLIWSKGYFDVLKAIDILVNREKLNVKCIFAGKFMPSIDDDPAIISNKEKFDRFIENNKLNEVVEYYQGLYGDLKDEHFYKSNVFVLPTYYINEGQPVSIIEAMAYGCVPIVTNYRHIPMMINDGNGCFVPPKNPECIAKHIKFLIENRDIYTKKSKQCVLDYQSKFRFEIYATKVMKVIQSNIWL